MSESEDNREAAGNKLDQEIERANRPPFQNQAPPLRSFGLVLHHDGSWSHEGQPFRNRRLREKFDRSVRYLPDEGGAYVVQSGRFRGLIDVEEAGFFVDDIDLSQALVRLSDSTSDKLDVATLVTSPLDGALLCRVKRDLEGGGLIARFSHRAQAEFMNAIDDTGTGIDVGGQTVNLPAL
jgi:hypothetical protein